MYNIIFRVLLTISSTFCMITIYGIKEKCSIPGTSYAFTAIILVFFPAICTRFSIYLSRHLDKDSLPKYCECILADNVFLPVSLGYFWVALSIEDTCVFIVVFVIIFLFSYWTQSLYFNPWFLCFGYHFYHVKTLYGSMIFVAAKGSVARNADELDLNNLRRINNMTFIAEKGG